MANVNSSLTKPQWTALIAILALASGTAAVMLWPQAPTRLAPDDTTLVALGHTVYDTHCARCHGAKLEGQPNWQTRGANGRLPAPPQDATGHTWHHPDELLITMTRDGLASVAPLGYETDMPAFKGVLSDHEIIAALSYIKSTWPTETRRRHDALNRRKN